MFINYTIIMKEDIIMKKNTLQKMLAAVLTGAMAMSMLTA